MKFRTALNGSDISIIKYLQYLKIPDHGLKITDQYYRNPLNNLAAPGVRKSLKRRRFRPYFTAINKERFNFFLTLGAYPFQQTRF